MKSGTKGGKKHCVQLLKQSTSSFCIRLVEEGVSQMLQLGGNKLRKETEQDKVEN